MSWRLHIILITLLIVHVGTLQAQLRFTEVYQDTTLFGKTLGHVDLNQFIFHQSFNIAEASVQSASFNLTEFRGIGDFGSTTFTGRADIDNARFWDIANFLRSNFNDRANFGGTKFQGEAIFDGTEFRQDALFFNCEFHSYTNFSIARFLRYTAFDNSAFAGRTSFNSVIFAEGASFKGVSVADELLFNNAVFLSDIDFSNIKNIDRRIDLTVVNTDTIQDGIKTRRGINLTNSDIAKFKIDYSLFYLQFDSSATFEYRSNVYQTLMNTFKLDGYTESYEILDKEYKEFVYVNKNAWLTSSIDKYWWDFGYAKHYVFYWIFAFVFSFTAINFFIFPFLQNHVYRVNNIETNFRSKRWNLPLRLYYSLVYTSVLFFSLSVKLDNLKYKHPASVAYIFLIYILGIICLAYAANFVITK